MTDREKFAKAAYEDMVANLLPYEMEEWRKASEVTGTPPTIHSWENQSESCREGWLRSADIIMAAEREACAKLADVAVGRMDCDPHTAQWVLNQIRARSQP